MVLFLRDDRSDILTTYIKQIIKVPVEYLKILLKWIVISAIVGLIGGVTGSLFHLSIDFATGLRQKNNWLILLLPIGGLFIAFLYRLFCKKGKIDTNLVIESIRTEKPIPFVMAPLIFVSTVITHLLGGSAGREGAALQLGGSLGYALGRVFRLKQRDKHIIVMSGMSAVFAALFGTPVTAMFFALEVTSVGVMYYVGLVPCIISALLASRIALLFGISPVRFALTDVDAISWVLMLKIICLAVLCALVSILFCFTIKKFEKYGKKFILNVYLRAALGGILLVLLTIIVRSTDYNGAGMNIISAAILDGTAKYEAFALKILFTAITIAAGFKGGEIVPSFFIGSTFGCVAGSLLGLDPCMAAAIGFVAVFCGVVNCPVASFVLAIEVFGGNSLLIFAVVCAISYMMSGYSSIYKSQKIMYSKLYDKYIDA